MSYKLSKAYALSASQGSSQRTTGKMIVFHSTANLNASAANNAAFEKRTWYSNGAYVHFIAGDGVVYQVGTPGYVAWGAGGTANAIAPVQIEMEESSDKAKQLRIYNTLIELVRDMCKKYGIAYTFEAGSYTGVQTHRHIAQMNHETDHTDPWAPLGRIGKTKEQVAHDIKNGVNTVAKPTYWKESELKAKKYGLVQCVTDVSVYSDWNFKTKRRVVLKKGSRVYGRKVVGKGGSQVSRFETALGYVTANKKYTKIIK